MSSATFAFAKPTTLDAMRIATSNVNSVRIRAHRVIGGLVREDINVLAMQEIKYRPG